MPTTTLLPSLTTSLRPATSLDPAIGSAGAGNPSMPQFPSTSPPDTSVSSTAYHQSTDPPPSTVSSSKDTNTPTPSVAQTFVSTSSHIRSTTNVGAIAGGVLGGVVLLLLVVLLVLRKPMSRYLRRARNKRIAPSAEFVNTSSQLFHSQSRLTGLSTTPVVTSSHHRGKSSFSVRDLGGGFDERPPPFTPGSFRDPVIEKVTSAAQQREMFFQTHASPPTQNGRGNDDSDAPSLYDPYVLPNPFEHSPGYPLDTFDFPATSPILSSEEDETAAGPSSTFGHGESSRLTKGWAA
ncbi:uncharacterized protein PHACADRAFT_184402 [Phanerochaete carnosa HHB-10118-sp]|uniref:Uncharacterized protein n=1 Tax=Phanerochaete carnosa (strain HHB-10118-sp) TaxID=650164 RepID=K5UZL5_PHACS|nr:uncharacterized protein PHACADRAFT_184402 [Phanerochaete carnosa HHB-10118-sp]EKM55621.1 hypothetical protein PHACADRAFT_184402 [Phanerochaete carnosa HHB-10118-sp]